MKIRAIALSLLSSSALAVSVASAKTLTEKLPGTYSSNETNFVTVKRLTFTKEKDGSIKIHGALVGFPDEVSIGDATAETFAARNNKQNPNVVVAKFSSEKYKPLMIITPQPYGDSINGLGFTCYMNDVDGSQIHIEGSLQRQDH